jgi:hypothetical protein
MYSFCRTLDVLNGSAAPWQVLPAQEATPRCVALPYCGTSSGIATVGRSARISTNTARIAPPAQAPHLARDCGRFDVPVSYWPSRALAM